MPWTICYCYSRQQDVLTRSNTSNQLWSRWPARFITSLCDGNVDYLSVFFLPYSRYCHYQLMVSYCLPRCWAANRLQSDSTRRTRRAVTRAAGTAPQHQHCWPAGDIPADRWSRVRHTKHRNYFDRQGAVVSSDYTPWRLEKHQY